MSTFFMFLENGGTNGTKIPIFKKQFRDLQVAYNAILMELYKILGYLIFARNGAKIQHFQQKNKYTLTHLNQFVQILGRSTTQCDVTNQYGALHASLNYFWSQAGPKIQFFKQKRLQVPKNELLLHINWCVWTFTFR